MGISRLPLAYFEKRMCKFHQIFCTCHTRPRLGHSLTTVQYVGFVDDVICSHNMADGPK